MENKDIKKAVMIEDSWYEVLKQEFMAAYFQDLIAFLKKEKSEHIIYPPGGLIFKAFDSTPFEKVKVVILGQDPYHGKGQAEGLSFSVPLGVTCPPSLKNIYKEMRDDLGIQPVSHGHLAAWAEQGVLLLNSVLTVRASQPGSHRNKGWELFTDHVIQLLSSSREHIVFILWGKYAQEKERLIDATKHCILKAAHPSPYSAAAGFFGCRHFSKTNAYLQQNNILPVNWDLNR